VARQKAKAISHAAKGKEATPMPDSLSTGEEDEERNEAMETVDLTLTKERNR
jgi:hypothetical protein